ncbi:MAG: spondin domain-containing protein [Bacteroidota bacterium]
MGIAVLHALPEPLFTLGQEDRGVGLERIAEDGMPGMLFDWFTETGSNGSPLRLASSLSVFSPGLVYAFNSDSDPFFTQGEAEKPESGLEELAEDGNNAVAVDYLSGLGLPVAASNETAPIGPGGALTFSIEVPQGQGYKLGIATMLVQTNDWFISYNNNGVALFNEDGTAFSGTSESDESYLFDAGTEVDEPVGFGIYQAPRQNGGDDGPEDDNTLVRRVSELEDVQFGKGVYNNPPGVVYLQDPRGGYNLVKIDIQPQ